MRKSHKELKNIHKGKDIWVVAAGPSMNYVDPGFFDKNKIVIGVNRISNFFKCDYTVNKDHRGFEELKENLNETKVILSQWRHGNPGTQENTIDCDFYFFTHPSKPEEQPDLDVIGTDDIVVSWSTITSALHLAAYMGAKNILICGHDCGALNGEITVKDYYKNLNPDQGNIDVYHTWLKTSIEDHTIKVKEKIKEIYGTNIYSLNPFINLALEGNKYERRS